MVRRAYRRQGCISEHLDTNTASEQSLFRKAVFGGRIVTALVELSVCLCVYESGGASEVNAEDDPSLLQR